MKAAGYIRVSTEEQALRGYSLAAQEELLRKYAAEHNMEIAEIYADEGVSAAKSLDKRKECLRLLSDAEKGKFQVVLFKDITRWTRSAATYYRCQERLDKANVGWIAVEQPYLETVTPTGRFQVSVMIGTSQLEAEQTGQRIRFVQDSQVNMGYYPFPSHCAPRGYRSERQPDGHMKLVVDPEQKPVIEKIYGVFLRTFNLSRVSEALHEDGIDMSSFSIARTLRNPIYKGVFRGVEGFCEPIISAEEWDKAQRAKRSYSANKHKGEYIFSGIVKCDHCGKTMRGLCPNDKYHMYQCRTGCRNTITQRELEQKVLAQMQPALDRYKLIVKQRARDEKKNEETRKKLKEKLKRLTDLYIDGMIDRAMFDKRKAEIDRQLEDLAPQPEIPELATNWKTLYDKLNTEQKSALWRAFCDHITVDRDRNVSIAFESTKVLADKMAKFNQEIMI